VSRETLLEPEPVSLFALEPVRPLGEPMRCRWCRAEVDWREAVAVVIAVPRLPPSDWWRTDYVRLELPGAYHSGCATDAAAAAKIEYQRRYTRSATEPAGQ
jgi:hypothetical protein